MHLIPVYEHLVKEFSNRGFSLYIVGGTSRDMILGRNVLDLDFVTDAKIEEMKEFLNIKNCFENVGSVTIEFEDHKIDLTTLRKEEAYEDSRHPSKVTFIKDTKVDSLRRDFTINALYIDKDGNVLDYHDGLYDLKTRNIKMIGETDRRIKEDPLRILRALRFSLILDFNIDNELQNAIRDNARLLKELSYSKCLNEIKKMMDFNKSKAKALLKHYEIDNYIPIEYGFNYTPICDMHSDTITRKSVEFDGIYSNEELHVDIKKMMKSHYLLQCFAVFINGKEGNMYSRANQYIDRFEREIQKNSNVITKVTKYSEAMDAFSKNKIAALLTLEEGGIIEGNIDNLVKLYKRGVRMMTLTWNYPNEIGYPNINMLSGGSLFSPDVEHGLTPFGIEVVKWMNKLGMIIDVSHLSDKGFYDVMKYSTMPVVASHSNARSVCAVSRNLTDDMIRLIASKHGLIGINFCPEFLKTGPNENQVVNMVNHIKHIKEIGGVGIISLGTDFDGIPTPVGLEDASKMHRLEKALIKEGFTKEEIEKIFYKNFLRVFKRVCK